MFNEYDVFILKRALADETIPAGTRGVVLMLLSENPRAYEVEFSDGKGGNLGREGTYTLTDDDMQPCGDAKPGIRKKDSAVKRGFCRVLDFIGIPLTLLAIALAPGLLWIRETWNGWAAIGLMSTLGDQRLWMLESAVLYTTLCLVRVLLYKSITRWNVIGSATLWVIVAGFYL